MNALLKEKLASLTSQEKVEVIDYLLPEVRSTDDALPRGLLSELERRDAAYEVNPASGMTLEEFEKQLPFQPNLT